VDDALEAAGRRRRVALSAPSFLLAPDLLAATDPIATVPARVAALWAGRAVAASPPVALPAFPIAMAWSPRTDRDAACRWLRERLTRLAAAAPAP
jgi:DNA-binding transcriptional LysR family regulator